MITRDQFVTAMEGLYSLMPFAKALPPAGIRLAWASFPEQAKQQLTPAMLAYAATQFLLDADRNKETPPHLALLRYLYRMGDGSPRLDWGLKADLQQRMANAGTFHGEPRSEADQIAAGDTPAMDGRRSESQGVLARLGAGVVQ